MTMSDDDRAMSARITDERIAKMRLRIGVPVPLPPPFNTEAHVDTMRHYAHGFGDPNPLYCDPEYGARTRWGSIIGAPLYIATLGRCLTGPMPDDIRQRSKGAFAGLGEYYGGSRWEFHVPVRPGDRFIVEQRLIDVQEQESRTAGRRSVRTDTEARYTRESDGALAAVHRWWFFHIERSATAARDRSKDPAAAMPSYELDEIEEIERALLAERPRGAEPRYVEDVRPGDQTGTLLKGPMRISDVLAWRIGNGPGSTQWGAFRLMALTRQRVPAFFTRNEFGAWDVVQRLHWEPGWAQRIGQPRPYDEGPMREAWLAHVATDWMGDDGWLESIESRITRFNYQGDLTKLSGTVSAVEPSGRVTLDIVGVNQRGEQTCGATAVVRLPSRSGDGAAA
jgi:acyl dehydratase